MDAALNIASQLSVLSLAKKMLSDATHNDEPATMDGKEITYLPQLWYYFSSAAESSGADSEGQFSYGCRKQVRDQRGRLAG